MAVVPGVNAKEQNKSQKEFVLLFRDVGGESVMLVIPDVNANEQKKSHKEFVLLFLSVSGEIDPLNFNVLPHQN